MGEGMGVCLRVRMAGSLQGVQGGRSIGLKAEGENAIGEEGLGVWAAAMQLRDRLRLGVEMHSLSL